MRSLDPVDLDSWGLCLHSSHLGERVRAVGTRAETKPKSLQGTSQGGSANLSENTIRVQSAESEKELRPWELSWHSV
jgi:hypothetical protein